MLYTKAEIAAKIDLTPDYIAAICYPLEHGEERLVVAVERGVMPANIAMRVRFKAGAAQRTGFLRKLSPGSHWGTDSSQTLRWREMDWNLRFPNRSAPVFETAVPSPMTL